MVDLQAFGVDQKMIYFESSDIICFLGKLKLFGNNTIPDTFFLIEPLAHCLGPGLVSWDAFPETEA